MYTLGILLSRGKPITMSFSNKHYMDIVLDEINEKDKKVTLDMSGDSSVTFNTKDIIEIQTKQGSVEDLVF